MEQEHREEMVERDLPLSMLLVVAVVVWGVMEQTHRQTTEATEEQVKVIRLEERLMWLRVVVEVVETTDLEQVVLVVEAEAVVLLLEMEPMELRTRAVVVAEIGRASCRERV